MITKNRAYFVIFGYILIISAILIPEVPELVRATAFSVLSLGTLAVIWMLYDYYGKVIESKNTVLTYCMQMITVLGAIGIIWAVLTHAVMAIPSLIQTAMEKQYAGLTCSVFYYELWGSLVIAPFIAAAIFLKVFLKLCPNSYLEMNHERGFKLLILLNCCISIGQVVVTFFLQDRTLCIKAKFEKILFFTKLASEYMAPDVKPLVGLFNVTVWGGAWLVLKLTERCRGRNSGNQQGASNLTPLPEIPTVTDYNMRVLKGEFLPKQLAQDVPATIVENNEVSLDDNLASLAQLKPREVKCDKVEDASDEYNDSETFSNQPHSSKSGGIGLDKSKGKHCLQTDVSSASICTTTLSLENSTTLAVDSSLIIQSERQGR